MNLFEKIKFWIGQRIADQKLFKSWRETDKKYNSIFERIKKNNY